MNEIAKLSLKVMAAVCLLIVTSAVSPVSAVSKPILYVKEGCSHCAKVEAFIEQYGLGETIEIKDVVLEPEASEDYTKFMEEQNVPAAEQGVPFLVYGDMEWLSGDTPIIKYLAEENDITIEDTSEGSNVALLATGGIFVIGIVGYGVFSGIFNSVNGRKKR